MRMSVTLGRYVHVVSVDHALLYVDGASCRTTNDDAFKLENAQQCLGSQYMP